MMNSSASSSSAAHLQQYHTHVQQLQQASSQYNHMQQPQPTMIGPGSALPPPYSGPMQAGPPPHISMHAPNATVVSQQNCQIVPTNSIPPNAAAPMPMHMTSRPASMGFSQHPGSAMMKTQSPNNPNASKFMSGPGGMHTTGSFGPNGQTNGQIVGVVPGAGNIPYTMQQQMVFNNNNTVPYNAHVAAAMQRQIHPSQMMSTNSIGASGVPQNLPNKPGQMGPAQMILQEQMIPHSSMMPGNSTSVAQMRNGTTIITTPQNSYINMQGQQIMNQIPQENPQQTQNVNGFAVGPGLKPSMVAGNQHQMGMMLQQQHQQSPGMTAGSMNAVGSCTQLSQMGNASSAAADVMNRQRFLALQQQQRQISIQKSQMMRQAVTPPATIEAASSQHLGSSAFPFNQQQQTHLGQGSIVGVSNRFMDTSGAIVNNQIPSPASNNSQIPLTASTAMIGAPHSVPASQEVMPPSPQVTNNPTAMTQFQQPAMFTNNSSNNNQSLSASFAKRQSTTPPAANARATPSPISRKNSTSTALKRRSSSTSSFDQGAESMGVTSTSANDLNEPTKVCRLTLTNVPVVPSNNVTHLPGTTSQQQQHNHLNNHPHKPNNGSHTRNPVANTLSSSNICHYNTLTLDALHRKDSSCSISTDTHSSPDSGLGDSGSESNGSCGSIPNSNNNTTTQQHLITASSPQCIITDSGSDGGKANTVNNNNTTTTAGAFSSEQMLENLIQELGIEKLDHLPELLDIFDSDVVFSNGTSSYDSNNAQQTRPRAAHIAAP